MLFSYKYKLLKSLGGESAKCARVAGLYLWVSGRRVRGGLAHRGISPLRSRAKPCDRSLVSCL